jgi:Ran GTPase-activating protein (RanGAP) involved in mRNA processing and transport
MKKLDLKDNGIGNTGPMALADSLRSNKVLQRLDISDNGIDGPKAVTMIKALWECKSLTHLNLSDNQFGGIDSGSSVFPEGLPKNTTFECLVLQGC